MRVSILSLIGSIALTASAFLPWIRLGDVGLAGIPDPAGFFVLVLGLFGVVLSVIRVFVRRDTRQWLVLVGLAGLTTLVVVWLTGLRTVEDRAQAHAEAVAIVDNVAVPPVPAVRVGAGLILGLAGAAAVAVAGLSGAFGRVELEQNPRTSAEGPDDRKH